jgi:hypothetical protein
MRSIFAGGPQSTISRAAGSPNIEGGDQFRYFRFQGDWLELDVGTFVSVYRDVVRLSAICAIGESNSKCRFNSPPASGA